MEDFLFELIGAIYGDGHVHSTENRITIVGSLEDYYYYQFYLKPNIEKLFDVKVYIRKRKDRNAYYLSFENKKVMQKLLDLGLSRGKKENLQIFNFPNKIALINFLRGLFDTDGSLKFSKQTKDYNYYPRLQFCFKKSDFSFNLGELFEILEFNYAKWYDKRDHQWCYQISGKKNLEQWQKMVGFSNIVHFSKYLFWKKYGYCISKSTLDYRLKTLNLKIEDLF
ncbi:hypothetical protein HN681_00200 [archaeon]|jgi:hypothetical protein|nr:hypothetical protein [archaeon]MBT3730508.1 hypothetical protein [archaeon]MBT4669426.1 hypothetical protein [archaeon]MBT5029821.1 hypothetical protein [archaeon]MBT5288034.1 hypothetical protein [archaeon]